ncbi:MAG: ferredoxin thioredoxin reductase catalytic beta chain [Clostridiales bacterium]|jgi:ferredoxin-thioredoxin reductase catalytic subunit|nr:ferredoxin thioredoxin reductase catalytic beta chain [Clostridiales bacterium]HOB64870.1 ferredoxin-thioredoxin reductase catalytic domain-containing protein [Clostridia bacterium]HOK82319.1 ferredoxin-thioredoxin reductase catalytic domain-containing protein [Clostridia bacterium]HOL61131.1 ferredoxin-thioredoxin reductase catalytic domain-containing protein [Clostridia bacterium]HPO53735.1 ferredoxin-thioredoxin reductase catalytic domain-containing protein [Clostridia bacterium]
MKITFNENKKIVEMLKARMSENGGYCPCRREKNEDTMCLCKEFREQIADPDYEGYCHCMLYYKAK